MTLWITLAILIIVLTGFSMFGFAITVIAAFENHAGQRKWHIVFAIGFLLMSILGVKCAMPMHDDKVRDAWFMNRKPTCTEDTIECLTDKAEWYEDSIRYRVNRYPTKQDEINALKEQIKYFEQK